MAPTDEFAPPAFGKVLLSFALGIGLGVVFVLPAVRDDLLIVDVGTTDPVGNVVLIGVLSIAVVTTGLFGLYRLFWLVDR